MIDSGDLIRLAIALASGGVDGGGRGRPRVIDLRNAVRATYYAMFHALAFDLREYAGRRVRRRAQPAGVAADVPRPKSRLREAAVLQKQRMMSEFPIEARRFGKLFNEMQRRRHSADYDPLPQEAFDRETVLREMQTQPSA